MIQTPEPACLICGAPLIYEENVNEKICSLCGKIFDSNAVCENGHFVCDACHAEPGISAIQHIAQNTDSKNPYAIAVLMMNHSKIHMHGPEHHILLGAALLAAYKNSGGKLDLLTALDEMIHRGKLVPGGFCGLAGTCGAAVSVGMFYSIITKTTPLSTKTWGQANLLTANCLKKIGEIGGPRCCKRNLFLSAETAVDFVRKHENISMKLPEKIVCGYFLKNRECLKEQCPFFPRL